ncbi:MAG: Group 2 Hemoglobin-like protein YjbI [Pseudomonadota bacterium]
MDIDDSGLTFSLEHTPYQAIGGAPVVRHLVDSFYDLMDLLPEYQILRTVHGASLDEAREKLYQFLSGWLGGPPLYTERHGHPRLRARHLPFRIGEVERDQWMSCMNLAMVNVGLDKAMQAWLSAQLFKTADWMRNQ